MYSSKGNSHETLARRLLDSKQRTIGVDRNALDTQVEEHTLSRDAERKNAMEEAKREEYRKQLADQAEYEYEIERAKEQKRMVLAWKSQKRENRKEWDLNDPDQLSKERPPRVGEDIPATCGPSSLQVFDAEFRGIETPRRNRRELIEGNDALQREHLADEESEKRNAQLEHQLDLRRLQMANELELEAERQNKLEKIKLAQQHHAEAFQRRRAERREKDVSEQSAMKHMDTMRNSSLLVEDRNLAISNSDPTRVRPDHFKGFSQEEIDATREFQLRQIEERRRQLEEDRQQRAREEAQELAKARSVDEVEQSEAQLRKQEQIEYYRELKAQAHRQRRERKQQEAERKQYHEVCSGGILSRFGTSLK